MNESDRIRAAGAVAMDAERARMAQEKQAARREMETAASLLRREIADGERQCAALGARTDAAHAERQELLRKRGWLAAGRNRQTMEIWHEVAALSAEIENIAIVVQMHNGEFDEKRKRLAALDAALKELTTNV